MGRLGTDTEMVQQNFGTHFSFSGARISNLGASEYTLVNIVIDKSGSVVNFAKDLRDMLIATVESCQRSPRSGNLLIRAILFNSNGIEELHGFKPLADINPADYQTIHPGGMTPLYDTVYGSIGATNQYGKDLFDNDFTVNALSVFITDGEDTGGVASMKMIKNEIEKSVSGEVLESHISILIGINDQYCKPKLELFVKEAGLTHYISAGDVTPAKLAKIGGFISQSISSQSQSLGTGGPSQNIVPVI